MAQKVLSPHVPLLALTPTGLPLVSILCVVHLLSLMDQYKYVISCSSLGFILCGAVLWVLANAQCCVFPVQYRTGWFH